MPFSIKLPGDAHDFCKKRSAFCTAKIGAGEGMIKNYYALSDKKIKKIKKNMSRFFMYFRLLI